jgi:hypothetical protein
MKERPPLRPTYPHRLRAATVAVTCSPAMTARMARLNRSLSSFMSRRSDPRGSSRCIPRLHRIHDRPRRAPLIPRRPVTLQRGLHRVLRTPHHPRDHLDRQPLRPVQPTDLRPVLHGQHPNPSLARLQPGSKKGGQNSGDDTGSVFTRRRQKGIPRGIPQRPTTRTWWPRSPPGPSGHGMKGKSGELAGPILDAPPAVIAPAGART